MRLPWRSHTKGEKERREAEVRYEGARTHLRIALRELQQTIERIEDKQRRGITGDA